MAVGWSVRVSRRDSGGPRSESNRNANPSDDYAGTATGTGSHSVAQPNADTD